MGILYDLASKEQEALIKKINRHFKTKREKEWNEWEERNGIMKKPIEIIFEFTAEFKHEVEPMEGGNMDKIMSPGKYSMRFGASDVEFDFKNTCYTIYDSKHIANKTTELREAISYADMVVQYVNDGSGTKDFIEKATAQLKASIAKLR